MKTKQSAVSKNPNLVKEAKEFWSGLYIELDKVLSKFMKRSEVIDFNVLMSSNKRNSIIIDVLYESSKDLHNVSPIFNFDGWAVEISFRKNFSD